MVMIAAPGIETLTAIRAARFAMHILMYGQLRAAGPAEYRLLLPLALRPDLERVTSERIVAFLASVIHTAALHLDRDDVRRPVVMLAARLRIQLDSAHIQWFRDHVLQAEQSTASTRRLARHLNVK